MGPGRGRGTEPPARRSMCPPSAVLRSPLDCPAEEPLAEFHQHDDKGPGPGKGVPGQPLGVPRLLSPPELPDGGVYGILTSRPQVGCESDPLRGPRKWGPAPSLWPWREESDELHHRSPLPPGGPGRPHFPAQTSTGQAGRLRVGQLEYLSARLLPCGLDLQKLSDIPSSQFCPRNWLRSVKRPPEEHRRVTSKSLSPGPCLCAQGPDGNKVVEFSRATLAPRSS